MDSNKPADDRCFSPEIFNAADEYLWYATQPIANG